MELFRLLGTIAINDKEAISAINAVSGNAKRASSGMSKAFKTVGLALAGAFSIQKMTQFGKACIDAYNIQSQAELKLETIMKQRMNSSDKQIQQTKDLASAQQRLGVVGDELQLSGAQQLSTFLSSEKALNTLIPAMNNLAVQQNGVNVTSEGMVNIGNMMGKVLQGQTGALKRVGISFTDAQEKMLKFGTEEEKAATLAQVITNNVGEMNKKFAETDAGKIQQAKNLFGDLQEMLGERLIGSVANAYKALGNFSVFVMDNFDKIVSVAKGVATAFAGLGATKLILSLVSGFQKASLQVALFGMSADSAAFSQAILNGELTLGESIIAVFTGKVKLSQVATDAWNNSTLKLTLSQIRNTVATNASVAADALKASSLYRLVTAHKLATVAALGLAAPIIALAGYMLATGTSADEMAAKITSFADNLSAGITNFANKLPAMLNALIPAFTQAIGSIVGALPQIISPLIGAIPQIVTSLVSAITVLAPAILNAGVQLLTALAQAVPKVIPAIVAAIPQLIKSLISAITKNMPQILSAGVKLLGELAKGIIKAIPEIVKSIPQVIKAIVSGIKSGGTSIITVGGQLIKWLWNGIGSLVGWIGGKALSFAKSIPKKIKSGFSGIASVGINLIKGLWNGIGSVKDWILGKVRGFGQSILDSLRKVFDEHSPSKKTEEQGKFLALGLVNGIEKNKKYAKKSAVEMAQIILDAAKKRLDRYKTYNDMTLTAEIAFWNSIRKKCKKGTAARLEADKEYFDKKKELNEQLKQLEDDYIAKIDAANQKIADRAKSLLDTFNLFDEFAIKVDEENPLTGETLINNLESQVNALTDWTGQMASLKDKIGDTGLYKAIQDMGVSSLQQVQLINQMSAEELKKYTDLYDKRAEIAKQQAESELGTEVMNEMKEAYKEYEAAVESLGSTVKKKYKDIGNIIETVLTDANKVTGLKVDSMADLMKNGVKDMTDDTRSAFKSILEGIAESMASAVNNVESAVARMQAALASVGGGVSATVDVKAGAKVKANAKGGILTKPTIFGYTPATNTYQLGGEAGAEAIAPISTLKQYVEEAVASQNGNTEVLLTQMVALLQKLLDKDTDVYMDGDKVTQKVNKKLGFAL